MHRLVMRVASGFGAEDGYAGVGGCIPVGIETPGVVVEEGVLGEVGRATGLAVVKRCVHGPAEVVGGKQVHSAVADDGRGFDAVEYPLQRGSRGPPGAGTATRAHAGAGAVGGMGKVKQVRAFGVV